LLFKNLTRHFTNSPEGINPTENQDKVEEKLNETISLPVLEDTELNSCVDLEKFYHLEKEYGM